MRLRGIQEGKKPGAYDPWNVQSSIHGPMRKSTPIEQANPWGYGKCTVERYGQVCYAGCSVAESGAIEATHPPPSELGGEGPTFPLGEMAPEETVARSSAGSEEALSPSWPALHAGPHEPEDLPPPRGRQHPRPPAQVIVAFPCVCYNLRAFLNKFHVTPWGQQKHTRFPPRPRSGRARSGVLKRNRLGGSNDKV